MREEEFVFVCVCDSMSEWSKLISTVICQNVIIIYMSP